LVEATAFNLPLLLSQRIGTPRAAGRVGTSIIFWLWCSRCGATDSVRDALDSKPLAEFRAETRFQASNKSF
jgi:hypothetical protein